MNWSDLEQIVEQYQSMVFSIALRMTNDRGLAEEIAQDVFLELDRRAGSFESEEHLCHWLRRVAMSRSTDALRRRRVQRIDQWVELEERHSAIEGASSSVLSARMEAMLAELPEHQRAALILRYQEDLTPEEIATTLSAPVATVKSQLQRGLKQLRTLAESRLKEFCRGA